MGLTEDSLQTPRLPLCSLAALRSSTPPGPRSLGAKRGPGDMCGRRCHGRGTRRHPRVADPGCAPPPNMAAAPRRSPTCCQPAGAPLAAPPGAWPPLTLGASPAGVPADWPKAALAPPSERPGTAAPPAGSAASSRRPAAAAAEPAGWRSAPCLQPVRSLPATCPHPPCTHGAAVRGSRTPRSSRRARPAPPGGPSGAAKPAEPGGTLQPPRVLLQVRAAGDQALHAEDVGLLDAGGTALAAASAPAAAPAVSLPGHFLQACAFPLQREGAGGGGKHRQKHPTRVRWGGSGQSPCAGVRATIQGTGKPRSPRARGAPEVRSPVREEDRSCTWRARWRVRRAGCSGAGSPGALAALADVIAPCRRSGHPHPPPRPRPVLTPPRRCGATLLSDPLFARCSPKLPGRSRAALPAAWRPAFPERG